MTAAPDWGTPPWHAPLDLPATPLPARTEVAVVGAGFTGLAAAWALARRGVAVTVLEAATVGAGASGRTGGLVLEHTAAGPRTQVEDCVPHLAALVGTVGIACDLRLGGCHELAHGPAADARVPGWLDGEARLGITGTVPGGTVDPAALLTGLARAAREAGATIHERTPVTAITLGTPLQVEAGGPVVAADHVVLALNAFTARVVPLPAALHTALTVAVCTAPLDPATHAALGLADARPFYTADLPYLWGRTLADGRLILGAGLVFDPEQDLGRIAIGAGDAAAVVGQLERRVRALHPALGETTFTHRWGGPVAFLPGAVPLLGPLPDAPRVLVTGAYAGHGIALGIRVGTLTAAIIADGAPAPAWGRLRTGGAP